VVANWLPFSEPMRRVFSFFLVFLGTLTLLTGHASAAGDNTVESSTPAAGEVLTLAPTQIQLRFTQPVGGTEAVAQMGLVLTCDSKITNLASPQLGSDGVTVSAALTQVLSNGNCKVDWTLPDGSAGSFTFTSNVQSTTTVPDSVPNNPTPTIPGLPGEVVDTAPRLGGPVGLMRWFTFFLVSAVFGGIVFVRLTWPEGVEYPVTERYFRQVGVLAVLAMYLLVVLMAAREAETGIGSSFSPTSWGALLETTDGRAVVARFVFVIALVYMAWITERVLFETAGVITTVLLGLTALTYGFDRFAGRGALLGVALNTLHMGMIAVWVGSIAIIWRVVLHGPGSSDLVDALRGWARIATPLTVGVVVTGVAQVARIDGISLINSGHGRVMLLKCIIVAGMIFVSAAVRQFIVRGLQRTKSLNERAVYRLKKPVGVELSLSIVVLATSSWLMAMRPPYILLADKGPRVDYAIVQELEGKDDFKVRVSITPGNVGANRVLIELFGPSRIQNFTVKMTPENPNFSGYTINVPITRPGGALIDADAKYLLRAPGLWKLEVTGVSTIGDLEVLTGQFIIADGVTVTTVPKQGLKAIPTTTTTAPDTTTVPPAATTTAPPPAG
jgi:putative copper export protein/methionine-rich copper-binding protein CopC